MFTIDDVISRLGKRNVSSPLPAPPYTPVTNLKGKGHRVCLAVESMRRHCTDEGWQIVSGLEEVGYILHGYNIGDSITDVRQILEREKPTTLFVQDKREWEGLTASKTHDPRYKFTHIKALKERPDIFKLTVIKDAHQQQEYHRQSADEIGCHAWVTYYSPRIVHHLAPYTRLEHLIRTYHTIKTEDVPLYQVEGRLPCVLSGAIGPAYPLRSKLMSERWKLNGMRVLTHPGYSTPGPFTPQYLRDLSKYKVSICTTSIYGYTLRKLIESTACGCRVITNLPDDEILPYIDGNLTRVHPEASTNHIMSVVENLVKTYDPDEQAMWSQTAIREYDYRVVGAKLAADIETMRSTYCERTEAMKEKKGV